MTGYIVIKYTWNGVIDGSDMVFAEWRNRIPVFSPSADLALVFEHREMAEHVRDKLSKMLTGDLAKGWEVWDLSEVAESNKELRKLLIQALENALKKE